MSHVVQAEILATVGGTFEDVADVSFSSDRWVVAFCGLSMIDSENNFDRDNAVSIDIAYYDGNSNSRTPWISGGDHWGSAGAFSNFHVPARVRYGSAVRFRLRTHNPGDIDAAGFGVLWSYLA